MITRTPFTNRTRVIIPSFPNRSVIGKVEPYAGPQGRAIYKDHIYKPV